MRQGSLISPLWAQVPGLIDRIDEPAPLRRPVERAGAAAVRRRWLSEPKTAVWVALGAATLIGGGRKLNSWWQARKAVARLGEPDVTPDAIEAVAEHGRAGVYELLRIFSASPLEPHRLAAGRALARLWRLDQLVAEEEKAIVRRGYTVNWIARRRYPRALRSEVPIVVTYGVPFLEEGNRRVGPANLEWSHRVLGARRAATEEFSPWTAGDGRFAFTIFPGDFDTNGPHRLVLQARIRTAGLTESWEIEPPHVPFQFEFDPILRLDAILTLPDAARDESIRRAIRLEPAGAGAGADSGTGTGGSGAATYLSLGDEWTLRNPPDLVVATPLACDLAHALSLELEGIDGRFPAGQLVVSGQGLQRAASAPPEAVVRRTPLGPIAPLPPGLIERPGRRRVRLWLEAAPDHGWADPEIRSIWPGQTHTNWVEVEIMRR
jgi:hypothetical protein